MVNPGIQSDDGTFQRETLDEIEERLVERARDELGSDVDLSQGSPIKQLIDVVILEQDYLWKVLEDTYYSAYYGHAYEDQLDKLLELSQFDRIPRRGATGEVTFEAHTPNEDDVVIAEGTRVATPRQENRPSIPFKTTSAVRLEAGETYISNVPIRACEPWETDLDERWLGEETNVAANTIEVFETPVSGIDSVTNPHPTGSESRQYGYAYIEGRDRETDAEFRRRFEESMGHSAAASLDALRSSTLTIQGVRSADIEENTTMVDNTDGERDDLPPLPPKSFRLTVLGDVPADEIAQEIVETRSAGIESYGEAEGVAYTEDGESRTENFDWSGEVDIYVEVDLKTDEEFGPDGTLEVEDAIIDYIGGDHADGDQSVGRGMGEDIIYDMVFKQAMNVSGVYSVDLRIGKDPNGLGTSDIFIDHLDTGMTNSSDVTVLTEADF